ncbi:hypothetical protein GH5_07274 [Leishmania sp. Ghana 2012 LV757]|uniref:hypothetical protein n=1 Tax=Leishmania sp. Ghana 2012 LV757 TaxID=2803181 RepID=UPI001B66020D|nr:hypothetical protein GH5_07274 [Leishmania sp. Ghana 2012 LV757]
MQKVKVTLGRFAATVRSTFGCASTNGDVIDSDEDDSAADTAKDGCSAGSEQTAFVEIDLLRNDLNRQRKFPGNSVRTAKYTLLTGLPLSLLYQFYKVSNFYFLLVMIITLVPGASPINPFSSIVPLCIVLGAGILKDLWEDCKRRKADKRANEMIVYVLRAGADVTSKGMHHRGSTAAATTSSSSGTPIEKQKLTSDSDGGVAEPSRAKGTTEDSLVVAAKEAEVHDAGHPKQNPPRRRQRVVRILSQLGGLSEGAKASSGNEPHGGEEAHVQDGVEMTAHGPSRGSSEKTPATSSLRHTSKQSREPTTPVAAGEPAVTFQPVRSCDVYPGDIMLFRLGEEVKADCVLLNTSLPDGLTYIETANLDGETNAKTRRANIHTVEALGTVEDLVEKALGVSASDAAAVHARMNGNDIRQQGTRTPSSEATARSKVRKDYCRAGGGADRGAGAAIEEASATDVKRLNGAQLLNSSSTSPETGAGWPAHSEKTAAADGGGMTFATAIPEPSSPSGDFGNSSPPHQHSLRAPAYLKYEGREATEHDSVAAVAERGTAHPYSYHQRGFSYPHQSLQRFASSSTTAIPLARTGAAFSATVTGTFCSGAGNVTSDMSAEHVRHQRLMTLNERLAEEGQLPVPRQLQKLSEQYERAVHSRTNSASVHVLSLTRANTLNQSYANSRPHGAANRTRESESVLFGDVTGPELRVGSRGHSRSFSVLGKSVVAGDEPIRGNRSVDSSEITAVAAPGDPPASGVVLIACAPTPDLSMWFGQLRLPTGEMIPLSIDQFIPRGCLIRNTDWVLGAVVYTGRHTKMLLNLQPKPHKMTNMARRLNHLNACFFLLNQVFMLLLCGLAVWSKQRLLRKVPGAKTNHSAWYIQWHLERYSGASLFWWRYLTNFVLLSYLIPMSLYVTLEFNKAMQMVLIGVDKRMAVFDEFTGAIKRARPKTSELNCQLGHVRYIFTDKTGTLTENLMTYVGGVVDGRTHSETEQPGGIGYALLRRSAAHLAASLSTNILSSSMGPAEKVPLLRLQHHHRHLNSSGGREADTLDDGAMTRFLVAMQKLNAIATDTSCVVGGDNECSLTHPLPCAAAAIASHADAAGSGDVETPQQDELETPPAEAAAVDHPVAQDALSGALSAALGNGGDVHPGADDGGADTVSRPTVQEAHKHPTPSSEVARIADDTLGGSGGGGGNPCGSLHTPAAASPSQKPTHPKLSSSYQWGTGVFGRGTLTGCGSGAVGVAEPGADGIESGGVSGLAGLSRISEAVLERDPLFRYLRALALCHSVVCFPLDAADGTAKAQRAAENCKSVPPRKKRHKRRRRDEEHNPSAAAGEDGAPHERKGKHPHQRHRKHSGPGVGKDAPRRHRGSASTADPAHSSAHHQHNRETAHHAPQPSTLSPMLPLADISGGNFVEIPYAVPSGPAACEDFGPYTTSGANGAGVTPFATTVTNMNGSRHQENTSFAALAATAVDSGLPTKDAFQLTASSVAMLHGRTSSTSWYQNRYLHRAMHSRNYSALASHDGGELHRAGGLLERTAASLAPGDSAVMEATASVAALDLEQFIDRSKMYEGQSLDEIALVNAARENGFSLFERTAKQMYVKALGRVLCYDIIAELEFTPQRKLMSILLQRRPDLDSEAAAASMSAGRSAHYHRRRVSATAATAAARTESESLLATASRILPNGGGPFPAEAEKANRDGAASSLPCPSTVLPSREAHKCKAAEQREEKDVNKGADAPAARALPLLSVHLPSSTNQRPTPQVGDSEVFTLPPPSSGTQHLPHQAPLGEPSSCRDYFASAVGSRFAGSAGAPSSAPGKYLLLVKGADSSMMEIVNMQKRANVQVKDKMLKELDAMAQLGLRTLVLGQRHLSEEEVREWLPIFHTAQCAMHDRSEKLHEAYALLEKDIDIVGTTAVEDKLQEEVPQTLEFCIQASIVVWMLTGDKRETAVTIAHTSGLVRDGYADYVCHLDVSDIVEEEVLLQQQKRYKEQRRIKTKHGTRGEASPPSESRSSSSSDAGDALKSPGASTTTHAHRSVSSGTRSQQPQSAQAQPGILGSATVASTACARREAETTNETSGSEGSELSANADEAQSLYARKCARIDNQLKEAEDKCSEGQEAFGAHVVVIVVDGKTLDFIFEDPDRARRFFLLGSQCRSAVCCRMTPLQKAKVVRMFKRNTNSVVLAIGDGANDVSMIQASSIGVGIMGLEGSQAELASDYALPKFRFLKRLLFVHGRFSVFREAHCIIYSLYKNVILTVGMIAYQFYVSYSGQALIDSWLLAMFSIFFTSLQPLMIGILDKDVEDELAESLPKLYPPLSQELMYFSYPYIIKWLFDGLAQGLMFFFFLMYTVGVQDNLYTHMSAAIEDYGATFFTMLVLIVDLRVAMLVTYYMIPFAVVIGLEIILLPVIELVYSSLHSLAGSNWFVRVANELYGTSGKFWLMLLFACGVLIIFTMASNMYIQLFAPWQNAGLAMRAARRSHHRIPYKHTKEELKAEYARLLARYEELIKAQQQQQREESNRESSGTNGKAATRCDGRSKC